MRDIHPKYNKITVQFPKGDTFETYSTYGEEKLFLDVDYRKHPAWTKKGVASANESNAKVTKFKEKFGNISFSSGASKKPAPAPAVEEVKQEAAEPTPTEEVKREVAETAPEPAPAEEVNEDNSDTTSEASSEEDKDIEEKSERY